MRLELQASIKMAKSKRTRVPTLQPQGDNAISITTQRGIDTAQYGGVIVLVEVTLAAQVLLELRI